MESPLLNFQTVEAPHSTNLFLGIEWPSLVNPLQYQQNLASADENTFLEPQLNEELTDRMSNSLPNSLLGDTMLLNGELNERIDVLMNDPTNDISIDPDLLTLKPKSTINERNNVISD